jgi:hypothetical protein
MAIFVKQAKIYCTSFLLVNIKYLIMALSYVSDQTGNTIAVQIPIEEWNLLKTQYPGMEAIQESLPQWQKDMLDKRLQAIADNPARLRPIEEIFEELDSED